MKCRNCGRVSDDVGEVNCAHCAFDKVDSHWMRPELPQGFDDREVFALFDKISRLHWELMPQQGLPKTPRARALRAFGQFLALKLTGNRPGRLSSGRPMVAPFANAVGRQLDYIDSMRVELTGKSAHEAPPLLDWERELLS